MYGEHVEVLRDLGLASDRYLRKQIQEDREKAHFLFFFFFFFFCCSVSDNELILDSYHHLVFYGLAAFLKGLSETQLLQVYECFSINGPSIRDNFLYFFASTLTKQRNSTTL
jgi:hypothetical protein